MKHKHITLTKWISALILFFGMGLSALYFLTTIYIGHAMRQHAMDANKNLLSVYLEKIDSNVDGINRFLSQFPYDNESISTMVRTTNASDHYFASYDIAQKLRSTAFIYNTFNGMFVYSHGALKDSFICQLRSGTSMIQQEDMRTLAAGEETVRDGWNIVTQEERIYLVSVVRTGDTLCGVWLDPESAIEPLSQLRQDSGGIVLMLDEDGRVLSNEDFGIGDRVFSETDNGRIIKLNGQRFLQVTEHSANLPVNLMALIPEDFYAGKVRITQVVVILIFLLTLCLLPIFWAVMNRFVSRPVLMLTDTMSRVGKGDLSAVAEENSRFFEFQMIAGSFNSMTQKIRQLQKDVYERKLSEQRTKLQYFQMQIRPHFFLNALNVIYSFSLTKRNDLIERLTLCLSQYFRYLFNCESTFVTLGAELEHIGNYMEIHRLRDQGEILYQQEVDEVLLDVLIPPLSIQPFVENSVKYGSANGETDIVLVAECRQIDGEQKLCITISDNGPGYPPLILKRFENEAPLSADITQKIGIVNVRQRLQLIFQENASVRLYNGPDGGACSELILPIQWQEKNEGQDDEDFTCG